MLVLYFPLSDIILEITWLVELSVSKRSGVELNVLDASRPDLNHMSSDDTRTP